MPAIRGKEAAPTTTAPRSFEERMAAADGPLVRWAKRVAAGEVSPEWASPPLPRECLWSSRTGNMRALPSPTSKRVSFGTWRGALGESLRCAGPSSRNSTADYGAIAPGAACGRDADKSIDLVTRNHERAVVREFHV